MVTFHISVSLENDAFQDGNDGNELARILRELASELENDSPRRGAGVDQWRTLYDSNGNKCGTHAAVKTE